MPQRLKKISEETIHENPWWKAKHDVFEFKDGETGDYFYSELPGTAIIIPVLPDGRIVLVLQHRYLMDKQSIEFPGGGVKEGQAPIEAAKNELFEETGCLTEDFKQIGVFEPSRGIMKNKTSVYIVQVTEQREPPSRDKTEEDMEILYRPPGDIDRMIQQHDIWCGMTIASWMLARHHFFKEVTEQEAPGLKGVIDQFIG